MEYAERGQEEKAQAQDDAGLVIDVDLAGRPRAVGGHDGAVEAAMKSTAQVAAVLLEQALDLDRVEGGKVVDVLPAAQAVADARIALVAHHAPPWLAARADHGDVLEHLQAVTAALRLLAPDILELRLERPPPLDQSNCVGSVHASA